MRGTPTDVLDEVLQEVDREWETERQDPRLRAARLWLEFRTDYLRPLAILTGILAGLSVTVAVLFERRPTWVPASATVQWQTALYWFVLISVPGMVVTVGLFTAAAVREWRRLRGELSRLGR